MESYPELRQKARKNIHVADHILTQTFPLIDDPKLLLAVLDNIFLSQTNALQALLAYEKSARTIPPYHTMFESQLNSFKLNLVGKNKFTKEDAIFLQDLKALITEHEESPVEFTRKGRFVICSQDYKIEEITPEQLKGFVSKAKNFLERVEARINE